MRGGQCGFTLVEVLVVCFLSGLLLSGFFITYLRLKTGQQWVSTLSLMMDRERFIATFMVPVIRQAGLMYCEVGSKERSSRLQGYGQGQASPRWLTGRLMSSDALVVQQCRRYQNKRQWVTDAYYIANTRRKDDRGHSIYALYRKRRGGRREELVSDVVRWRCRYGLSAQSTVGLPDLAAALINDWDSVQLVQMAFLMRSSDYVTQSIQCVNFDGHRQCGERGLLYRSFPLVVSVRE